MTCMRGFNHWANYCKSVLVKYVQFEDSVGSVQSSGQNACNKNVSLDLNCYNFCHLF